MAAELENVITGRSFEFEIEGKKLDLISCEPGHFRCELKDATMGNRQTNHKTFTVTKPHFDTWRIEKYYDAGELTLKTLFESFAGGRSMNTADAGTLTYHNREGGAARSIDFHGYVPLHYENVNLDSRNPGQAAVEVMEFSVAYCTYG